MDKIDSIVLTATANNRREVIAQLEVLYHKAELFRVRAAISIGELLIEQKADCKHGTFGAWVSNNTRLSERTAQLYMKMAVNQDRLLAEKIANIGDAQRYLASPSPDKQKTAKKQPVTKEIVLTDHDKRKLKMYIERGYDVAAMQRLVHDDRAALIAAAEARAAKEAAAGTPKQALQKITLQVSKTRLQKLNTLAKKSGFKDAASYLDHLAKEAAK